MIHKANLAMNVAALAMTVLILFNNNADNRQSLDTCALIKQILDLEYNITNLG